jgi:uncharacterized membrane protein
MNRYIEIDILKGIAVFCMVFFHIFYYANHFGFKEFDYNTYLLKFIAKVAQIIFITCVGINLVISKKISEKKEESKKMYIMKNIKRIVKLAFFALCMSLFTYFVFGDKYVKFGILHFMSLSSLLLFMFVDKEIIIKVLIGILFVIYTIKKTNPTLLSNIFPSPIGFIIGLNSNYSALDHFPIIPWMILICMGILIGNYIVKYEPEPIIKKNENYSLLEETGKHSLEIYAIHWLVLYAIFTFIYPKFRKNLL